AVEVERCRRCAAHFVRNEDAARGKALQAGRILHRGGAPQDGAAIVALVAGARVGAAGMLAGYETTGISAFGADAARRRVDGTRQSPDPAVEVVPAENAGKGIARHIVFRPSEMELAEEPAFIARLLEQLGRCHVE